MDFIFKVSEQSANIILQALAKTPYEVSANVIHELQKQANEQIEANNKKVIKDEKDT